jgi:hypothetical protein
MNLYAGAILITRRDGSQVLAVATVTAESESAAKQNVLNELNQIPGQAQAQVKVKQFSRSEINQAR